MPRRQSSLSLNQKLTLTLAALTIITAVIVAFISGHDWFPPKSPKPTIVQTSVKSIAGGVLPQPNNLLTICRYQLQFFDSSDIPTSVISVSMDIYFDGKKQHFHEDNQPLVVEVNNTAVIVTVWGQNPPDIKEYLSTKSFDDAVSLLGERLPVQVKGHAMTNIFIDILANGGSIKPGSISSIFTIEFPDINPVVFPQTDCLGL